MTSSGDYNFHYIPSRGFPSLTSRDAQDLLMQWSMKGRVHCQCYSFDETFKKHEIKAFAENFFKSALVQQTLETEEGLPVENLRVEATEVPCTLLSMDLFNRCLGTVVHNSGKIKSCYEDYYESLIINDCVRQMLCIEDSEFYNLFSQSDRQEFLFRLFKHIFLGGELTQPCEQFETYTQFVRNIYKDLISVQRVKESDEVMVTSLVYEIKVLEKNTVVFPASKAHPNTFAYLIVNPIKRHVIVLSHAFGVGQF